MRLRPVFYILTIVALACCAPSALTQNADLHERLKEIVAASSLEKEGMAPWHMRMTFQLYDLDGKKKETGTVEEWWSSSTQRKVVVDSPSYHLGGASGDAATKDRREAYLVHQLLSQVVDPVPQYRVSDKVDLHEEPQKFGNATLSCLVLEAIGPGGMRASPAISPHLCTEPDKTVLRVYIDSNNMFAVRNKMGKFRDVELGIDNTINYDGKPAISGHIEALEAYQPDSQPANATKTVPPATEPVPPPQPRIPGGVLAGRILHKQQPSYPVDMRQRHIAGTVVLSAVITKTGTISSLEVIASPNPSLSDAAIDAVKTWTYQPYLLNGEPTEVDTTITVNFNLNP